MEDIDLILAEGFSQANLPAIEVSRAERNMALIGDPDYVLAVAADYAVTSSSLVFDINDAVGLVELIEQSVLKGQ
jgi:molybdopterin-guanine dinucleotide biosynthesis protein